MSEPIPSDTSVQGTQRIPTKSDKYLERIAVALEGIVDFCHETAAKDVERVAAAEAAELRERRERRRSSDDE
jgi:hypothetical protein